MTMQPPRILLGIQDAIRTILLYIGEDPDREGLRETPERVMRSYIEIFSGYRIDPASVFKCFEDGVCDEMVIVKNIPFMATCEHHLLPFYGKVHVGYLPSNKIVGLSKLARLVEIYARRLQVQERMTVQITSAITEYLSPRGCGCVIEAEHSCLACRGVKKQGTTTITSSLVGAFRTDATARAEFLQFVKG
jgi:GTP cyclohydrolase IA